MKVTVQVVSSFSALQRARPDMAGAVGLVPTMGALHAGHLSLVDIARARCDSVLATIFVNPTQFAPHEDFQEYPRSMDADLAAFEAAGVDLVYTPTVTDIYPNGPIMSVTAGPAAEGLESLTRPHFFDGVCTVVKTLFDQTRPNIAVFGEKDFQQLKVIEEMTAAQGMGIEILPGPTVRDPQGLALSSRNQYLSTDALKTARGLNRVLADTGRSVGTAPEGVDRHLQAAEKALTEAGFDRVDYVALRWGRVLAAAHLGATRLIDNLPV